MPVADIAELTRKHGIKLLVDAAQSAGILPIDVRQAAKLTDVVVFPTPPFWLAIAIIFDKTGSPLCVQLLCANFLPSKNVKYAIKLY